MEDFNEEYRSSFRCAHLQTSIAHHKLLIHLQNHYHFVQDFIMTQYNRFKPEVL